MQLAGNFTLELGLPGGWRILDELDDEPLRLEAIRQVLAGGSTAELTALLNLLFKGEAVRSVTQQIADIVAGLYGVFCDSDRRGLARPGAAARAAAGPARAGHRTAGRRAAPAGSQVAKAWHGRRRSCPRAGLGMLHQHRIGESAGRRRAVLSQAGRCRLLAALYEPLLRHARGVIVGKLVNRTEATYQLLAAYGEVYQRLKFARRGLRFDDVPRLLATGLADGLMQHAHWRLDTSIGHLLLDEFQDTSLPQWNVLKPFALACCDGASGHSFFCVGDVKQAIYRWRGGVSQLFDAARNELPGVSEQSLSKSYRSSQPVIDTVNQVFTDLPANQALDRYVDVARQWRDWFQPHTTAKTQLVGYTALCAAPRASDPKQQARATLEFAAERVAKLAAECPGKSIGVLTRRNKAVAQLIHLLRSKKKLPASQEGGNPLTDSAAVQLVLSLVKLADHPGDMPARYHVAHSPLASTVGLSDYADQRAAARLAARAAPAVLGRRLRPHDLCLAQTAVGMLWRARPGPARPARRVGLCIRPPRRGAGRASSSRLSKARKSKTRRPLQFA